VVWFSGSKRSALAAHALRVRALPIVEPDLTISSTMGRRAGVGTGLTFGRTRAASG
jgi:hypothetical protein